MIAESDDSTSQHVTVINDAMAKSPVAGKYDVTVDPNSAYEILQKRVQDAAAASPAASSMVMKIAPSAVSFATFAASRATLEKGLQRLRDFAAALS